MSIRAFLKKITSRFVRQQQTEAAAVLPVSDISDKERMHRDVAETCFPIGTKIVRISNHDTLPHFGYVTGYGFLPNGKKKEAVVFFESDDGEEYYEPASGNSYLPISKKLIRMLAKLDAPERWYVITNNCKYWPLVDSLPVSTIFGGSLDKPNLFGQNFIDYVESIGYYVDQ